MRNPQNPSSAGRSGSPAERGGFTMLELLVAVAIVIVLAAMALQVMKNMKGQANLARATQKIKNLGEAFVGYTADSGGLLPLEDAPGSDDWQTASSPEASEAWYNALPLRMEFASVGQLANENRVEGFYEESYPLYVPGAPYPDGEKRLSQPYFAIGMNSRLQRKDDDTGGKEQGTLASIQRLSDTVIFLERGMPKDKKTSKAQRKFNASPKANPRAFAARHNQKGILLFGDGHTEVRQVSELITSAGRIIHQEGVIWTRDPEEDPN